MDFHKIYQPHPALRSFVHHIRIHRVTFEPLQPRLVFAHPPLPEHCLSFYPFDPVEVELLPNQKRVQCPMSIIVGPRKNRMNFLMGPNHLYVKVGFQPGGLFRLLGIPMTEFAIDEGYDSSYLLGREMQFVTEQLREATSFDGMVAIVQQYLLHKLSTLKKELPIDRALAYLIQKGGLMSVDEVAAEACVSPRHLERLFQQRIGLPPKFYSRLIRFSNAWIIKENNQARKWTSIAHQCGYFDQMHFINDFKEFTGTLPSAIEVAFRKAPFSLRHADLT